MNINVFLVCYNEQVLLPHTIKHYKTLLPSCTITICDNESTDDSVEIAKSLGCNIITWYTNNIVDDHKLRDLKNNCWKDVKDGWIIMGDMDEWLCVTEADLQKELELGTSILNVRGVNVIGESKRADLSDIDLHSLERVKDFSEESKHLCFFRNSISEINYTHGAHWCDPIGKVQYSLKTYMNKHMQYIGLKYLINKFTLSYYRSYEMRKQGMAIQYTNDIHKITERYNDTIRDTYTLSTLPNMNWSFYKSVDYGGYDIKCVGRLPPDELIKIANNTPGCIAFNTLGYLKSEYSLQLNTTPWLRNYTDEGIYIKNVPEISFTPSDLTVYKCPFPKVRIGRNYDGGYIIAEIPDVKYSIILAGGVSDDISFEEDFLKKYNYVNTCMAYDGTIGTLPVNHPKITFVRKNIGFEENDSLTNLHEIIESHNDIFIKMDIEGGEIPWIKSLTNDHINRFSQIVMEFHDPFTHKEADTFKKLNESHILVHFHANNCCGTRYHKGIVVPNVFECTYIHKKYFTSEPVLNTDIIPSNIDMQNALHKPEIMIDYPPFVNI